MYVADMAAEERNELMIWILYNALGNLGFLYILVAVNF